MQRNVRQSSLMQSNVMEAYLTQSNLIIPIDIFCGMVSLEAHESLIFCFCWKSRPAIL